MNGESLNIAEDKKALLLKILPEVFTEGKIDTEKLKLAIGEDLNILDERYVLNWAGKSEAFKALQTPTTATLVPDKSESVNFDTTENIFIEGENLEVLKILQKSYYGKIKMIEIDPPYNTGSDSFIYPDRFSESKDDYLKRIGDKDEEGFLLKEGLFRKNSKDSGHYHSNWLSMMYPRLFLARNLLRDDGVIFVHIDDNEVHNLRMIMNEVFGEENFLGIIVWKKKTNGNNMGFIPPVHDYIVVFSKIASESCLLGFPLTQEYIDNNFSNPDNDKRGLWTTSDLSANHKGPYFPITNPQTGAIFYPPEGRYWVFNQKEVEKRIKEERIIFGKSGSSRPVQKIFLSEKKSLRRKAESWWDKHGMNEDGTAEIGELLGTKVFVHSKPILTIKQLCNIATDNEDIILDFFSGSATTAHAVLDLNKQDNGNRKFILVQLPEKCSEDSEAFKSGYKTIADIGKERIRRVIKKLNESDEGKLDLTNGNKQDRGFKSFKLRPSNFKIWRTTIDSPEELAKQVDAFVDPTKEGTTEEKMLYELLLKTGRDLNSSVEKCICGKADYYVVNGGEMVVVLSNINDALIKEIITKKPQKVIALDKLFEGNDQMKTNTVLQMKDADIAFRTI